MSAHQVHDGPRFGLTAIDQISFAVHDVDEASPRYEAMFGGPITVLDVPGLDVVLNGEAGTTTLRLGFGRTAGIEVELVQVVSGPWPTRDWLQAHGEGLHHLRYPVGDVAASRAAMEEDGFTVLMESRGAFPFVYLASPLLNGMVVELVPSGMVS